ncbi:MAG: SDR family oxidoreductase [Firmicutes bacterium]|nr:SDR family oxidoreductase [Bacillota bacterium]
MHILVTGAAGFIGSNLCKKLIQEGHQVTGIDNFLTSSPQNIEDLLGENFTFIKYDVTQFVHVPGRVDAIVHLASPASPVDYLMHPIHTLKVGSLGTFHLLGLAKEKRSRFLLASTSEIYGDPLIHPQTESYWGNVNPIGVRGVYDEAKRFGEAMAMAYKRVHGLDIKIARIFNTYGPKMRLNDGRVVTNFISQALKGEDITIYGTGKQTRSFCYVSDLVNGLTKLLLSDFQGPMNIGNPNEMTVLELAERILKLTNSRSQTILRPLPEDDPKERKPDISLAKKYLNWEPTVSLQEGLEKTISWAKNVLKKQTEIQKSLV